MEKYGGLPHKILIESSRSGFALFEKASDFLQGKKIFCRAKRLRNKSSGVLAGEEGIEPPLTVLETAALPLYYSPMQSCYYLCSNTTDDYYNTTFSIKQDFFYAITQPDYSDTITHTLFVFRPLRSIYKKYEFRRNCPCIPVRSW